jgi:outer membrane protein OmpA-like peptidoglycan-associated protein
VAGLTACTGGGAEPQADPSSSAEAAAAPVAPAAQPVTEDPICAGGHGQHVERLPDVAIPAVEVAAVTDPQSGAVLVPAYTIPAQVAEAGCVVRHDAPGGCVGAVDISSAAIPAVTIPAVAADGREYPSLTLPGQTRPGAHADEVCQVEEDGGLPTVSRPGVVREAFSRDGGARPGDDLVPTVRLEAVGLPDVDVDPVRLSRHELSGGIGRLDGDDRTSYVAPARVLFDTDSAELRPGAGPALLEIARRVRADAPAARLLVEGHTDDRGDEQYGMRLSERRAETVERWLVEKAGFDPSLITTRGWGEARPTYPNDTAAHRQLNRRVVITVLR